MSFLFVTHAFSKTHSLSPGWDVQDRQNVSPADMRSRFPEHAALFDCLAKPGPTHARTRSTGPRHPGESCQSCGSRALCEMCGMCTSCEQCGSFDPFASCFGGVAQFPSGADGGQRREAGGVQDMPFSWTPLSRLGKVGSPIWLRP